MLMGRGAARRCRLLLVTLLVVLLSVMAGLLAEDGWVPGLAQISDGDDRPTAVADAATPAVGVLIAPARPGRPGPPAAGRDAVVSRPGLTGADRAPPRIAPALA